MKWIDKRRKKSLDCKYNFSSLSRLRETMIRPENGIYGISSYRIQPLYSALASRLVCDIV